MPWERQPCRGCGGEKPAGRGRALCDTCERAPKKPPRKRPCLLCGAEGVKQPRKQFCDECRELRLWRQERRHQAKLALKRHPCVQCGGPKGPGRYRQRCDACIAKDGVLPACQRCHENPVRRKLAKLCQRCEDERVVKQRARWRAKANAERVRDPERVRARKRAYHAKAKADPVKHAASLERKRLNYQLRRRRKGLPVRTLHVVQSEPQQTLPPFQLAAAIRAIARRESIGNPFAVGCEQDSDGSLTLVCERAGVPMRRVSGWERGENSPRWSTADQVLTRLGLFWWEVWTEESVRLPALTVCTYRTRPKLLRGERKLHRMKVGIKQYGDLGPDFETLRRVEALMSGEAVAA